MRVIFEYEILFKSTLNFCFLCLLRVTSGGLSSLLVYTPTHCDDYLNNLSILKKSSIWLTACYIWFMQNCIYSYIHYWEAIWVRLQTF